MFNDTPGQTFIGYYVSDKWHLQKRLNGRYVATGVEVSTMFQVLSHFYLLYLLFHFPPWAFARISTMLVHATSF